MVQRTLSDCEGFARARAGLLRVWYLLSAVWCLFPAVFLLSYASLITQQQEELLTCAADLLAKYILQAAVEHEILTSAADRRQKLLEQVSSRMVKQLKEQDHHKDRFLAAMTHELRTPLNGIIGLTDSVLMTEKNSISSKSWAVLTTVRDTARRFHTLINNILDKVALRENRLRLNKQDVNLHHLLGEVVLLTEPLLTPNTRLMVDVPEELPLIVADYDRLAQVLFNLLGNAAKFTDGGSVSLSVQQVEDDLEIVVSDTGIGIPEEKIPVVFQAFEQVDMSHTRLHGGTGLGLNLAKRLVEAHGGTISVRSTEGVGTAFTIRQPIGRAARDGRATVSRSSFRRLDPQCLSPSQAASSPRPLSRPQSLVALSEEGSRSGSRRESSGGVPGDWLDVDALARQRLPSAGEVDRELGQVDVLVVEPPAAAGREQRLCQMLRDSGFRVRCMADSLEALKHLDNAYSLSGPEALPAVVLMDMATARMDSVDAVRLMRHRFVSADFAIILCSSEKSPDLACKALDSGSNDFLQKPVCLRELLCRVRLQIRLQMFHRRLRNSVRCAALMQELLPPHASQKLQSQDEKGFEWLEQVSVLHLEACELHATGKRERISEDVSSWSELVEDFEGLRDVYGALRLDTHGSCYAVMCGHDPERFNDHAGRIVLMAKGMIDVVCRNRELGGGRIGVRIGIHTGPVWEAIVGRTHPRYCVFGEAVSVAAHLSRAAPSMTVLLSDAAHRLVSATGPGNPGDFSDLGRHRLDPSNELQVWLLQHGEWQECKFQQPVQGSALFGRESAPGRSLLEVLERLDSIDRRLGKPGPQAEPQEADPGSDLQPPASLPAWAGRMVDSLDSVKETLLQLQGAIGPASVADGVDDAARSSVEEMHPVLDTAHDIAEDVINLVMNLGNKSSAFGTEGGDLHDGDDYPFVEVQFHMEEITQELEELARHLEEMHRPSSLECLQQQLQRIALQLHDAHRKALETMGLLYDQRKEQAGHSQSVSEIQASMAWMSRKLGAAE